VHQDNEDMAAAAGAIEAVISALKAHPTHLGVQEQGAGVLCNVTYSNVDYQLKAAAAGAIPVLTAAQRTHRQHDGIASAAKQVLKNIAGARRDEGTCVLWGCVV
jgi:hypothetical protein